MQGQLAEGQRYQQSLEQQAASDRSVLAVAETLPPGQRDKAIRQIINSTLGNLVPGATRGDAYAAIGAYADRGAKQLFGGAPLSPEQGYRADQFNPNNRVPIITAPEAIDYQAIRADYLSRLKEWQPQPMGNGKSDRETIKYKDGVGDRTGIDNGTNLNGDVIQNNTININVSNPQKGDVGRSVESEVLDSLGNVFQDVKRQFGG